MREKWTGHLIGQMHNEKITYQMVADELGITKAYVGMILNGKRTPKNGKQRIEDAVKAILSRRA